MSFTSVPLRAGSPSVHIDWSSTFSRYSATEDNIAKAIKWLQQYPNTKDIHIRIPGGSNVLLKKSLLQLGCKVTATQVIPR